MTVGVGRVENAKYGVGFDEYVVPVRGFLLQRGKLAGIYVKDGIIPVTEELPKEVHQAVVHGHIKKEVTVREIHYGEEDIIEVLIEADYQSWTIFTTS
ncbi:hypothetical protein CL1_0438 [Thermococcus cleftensis]|uniref:Uncharacterized protein n=1 Tax=Thermococcus cleftensis (strain DSM 27260 / KACC 17922 / CL1) TaxID=163003 RepID=I3ZSG3_THECF|nr:MULTISPECIES: hypothetical protein [Thermococcus]AFL94647.1 hypothetical protein CL1_0438 [Thermococcus cleftensis]NJE03469.1 hypothetical protein [Thermococcus sp. MV11]